MVPLGCHIWVILAVEKIHGSSTWIVSVSNRQSTILFGPVFSRYPLFTRSISSTDNGSGATWSTWFLNLLIFQRYQFPSTDELVMVRDGIGRGPLEPVNTSIEKASLCCLEQALIHVHLCWFMLILAEIYRNSRCLESIYEHLWLISIYRDS